MKAVIQTKSGPPEVLELQDIEKPIPSETEVLIKIQAGTVTAGDVLMRNLPFILKILMPIFGIRRKKIPGYEFAGEVEEIGKDVTNFKVGDQVFGTTSGLKYGGNAEYISIPEKRKKGVMTIKPSNMTFEEAAAVPVGAMTALFLLRKANIQTGHKVLIYGASGSVGTYAVQLAKYYGAEVTGVSSAKNLELVRSLGANKVIDYKKEDFTKSGETYDVIFDAVGKSSSSQCKGLLKQDGVFLSIKSLTSEKMEDLILLKEVIEDGKLKAAIDTIYPLEKIVEAHRYVDEGHKKGNIVITIGQKQN